MTINRTTVTVGLATLGLVGLAGGGIAWAASSTSSSPSTGTSTASHCAGYGMAYGKYSPMTAVADYLGLSRAELVQQMHSGKTLAQIATGQGKTVAGLRAVMITAVKRNLAADTSLTSAQRTAVLALMKNHLGAMVAGNHMSGMDMDDMGSGMMSGTGAGMMGGSHGSMMGH